MHQALPIQCVLPEFLNNPQVQWLGGCIESRLGELSRVTARFLMPLSHTLPRIGTPLQWKISAGDPGFQGYIQQVHQKSYDQRFQCVTIHASELSPQCAIQTSNSPWHIPKDFKAFISQLLLHEVSVVCHQNHYHYPVEQWLQWQESAWQLAQRIFRQLNLCPLWRHKGPFGQLELIPLMQVQSPHSVKSISSCINRQEAHTVNGTSITITCMDSDLQVGQWILEPFDKSPWIITTMHQSMDLDASILGHGPEQPYIQILTLEKKWQPSVSLKSMPILEARIAQPEGCRPDQSPLRRNGRYPIEFPWALGQSWGNIARSMTAGSQNALLPHAPILLGFPANEPDSPIIIAELGASKSQTRIHRYAFTTPQGNRILLDDMSQGKGRIQLNTHNGIKLELNDQNQSVEICYQDQVLMHLSPEKIQLRSSKIFLN